MHIFLDGDGIIPQKGEKFFNNSCFNKLGIIDFENVDKFISMQIKFALQWNRQVIKHGAKWSLNPPSRSELYPTMGIDSGYYNKFKKSFANELGELTMLWQCGVKHRKIALENGIDSWKNPNCNSAALGVYGSYAPIIDKIITINQKKDIIKPAIIVNNMGGWQTHVPTELYVDFETFNDICQSFESLPIQRRFSKIFLIGVGWINNGTWHYKKFICKDTSNQEECRVLLEFKKFINDKGNPPLFYWHAEKNFWKQSINSNSDITSLQKTRLLSVLDLNWIDMCKVFKQEPIVIKGCFGFGLKEIAKNMIKHKLISTQLEADCTNGMTAMIRAWQCYKKYEQPISAPIMLDIIKYNEFDVKVLCEIMIYLRNNHI